MLEKQIGQLFVFGFDGLEPCKQTQELLTKHNAGGVTLFKRNIESLEQVIGLNSELIKLNLDSEYSTLISVDQEGGRVARLKDIISNVPSMRKIGKLSIDNADLPYRLGALMAREQTALGFHLDFAPCLDIDNNKDDAIVGDRSFSQYAEHVAACGDQFIKGMQGAGLAACAKHFPGHGGTVTDSHFDLPELKNLTKKELLHHTLLPFKSAINSQVASIMTAHIMLPLIDSEFPATMSQIILNNILRDKLRFNNLIFSDDLNMKAVADRFELKDILKHGFNAGVDVFLICEHPEKTLEAINLTVELLRENKITKSQIIKSLERVKNFKNKFIGQACVPDIHEARKIIKSEPHTKLLEDLT